MEEGRLPVVETVKLALQDTVEIVVKLPLLCLTFLLGLIGFRFIVPSTSDFGTVEFDIWSFAELFLYLFSLSAFNALLAVPAYQFLIGGHDVGRMNFREKVESVIVYFAAYMIFVGWYLLIALICFFPLFFVFDTSRLFIGTLSLLFLTSLYGFCCIRWSLIFPAISVNRQEMSLRWSARLTEGMVWRIFLSHVLVQSVFWLILGAPAYALRRLEFENLSILLEDICSIAATLPGVAVVARIYIWCCDNIRSPVVEILPARSGV